jgi:hypothetical protein
MKWITPKQGRVQLRVMLKTVRSPWGLYEVGNCLGSWASTGSQDGACSIELRQTEFALVKFLLFYFQRRLFVNSAYAGKVLVTE